MDENKSELTGIDNNSKRSIYKWIALGTVGAILSVGIVMTVPIVKKHIEVEKLKTEIEKIQLEIELNKDEWAKCEGIMKTAHEHNEALREQQYALQKEYNSLVGFTMASDKE